MHRAQSLSSEDVMRELDARGYNCEFQTAPPGATQREDISDTDKLIVVLQGDVELEFAGHTVHPREGEEVLIPAWVPHTVRNIGRTPSYLANGFERDLAQTD